jgi:DNA polymerase-3 subunit epsilon
VKRTNHHIIAGYKFHFEHQPQYAAELIKFVAVNTRMLYAITDIETTGSHASGNSIIEIGVVLFDGVEVIREFSSLIDPGVRLPSYIVSLTGINDDMLEGAPPFHQIADELEETFEDAVFVAHNVNFDYSFIRAEFAAIGRNWNCPRLCTMRLARKAFPGFRSYGLGNLCTALDITNDQAHRALSDARAALEVFRNATVKFDDSELRKMIARTSGDVYLPPNLDTEVFNNLPESCGVYYLLNEKGKPVYIGKANNIRKRVRQHFTTNTDSKRMQAFMKEIHHIRTELTGTELIALLLEDAEIRKFWPAYNSAQKRKSPRVNIIRYTDQLGYNRLAMQISSRPTAAYKTFYSQHAARTWLGQLVSEFNIDPRLIGLNVFDLNATLPSAESHNETLEMAAKALTEREPSFVIKGSGRHENEISYVVVKNGQLCGYAFYPADENNPSFDPFSLTQIQPSETNMAIIGNINPHFKGYIDIAPLIQNDVFDL